MWDRDRVRQVEPLRRAVIDRICEDYGVSSTALLSKCRDAELVDLRCIAGRVLFMFGFPRTEVARALGRSNHTTVINWFQRVKERPDLQSAVKHYWVHVNENLPEEKRQGFID